MTDGKSSTDGVRVTVSADKVTPTDLWDSRDETFQKASLSAEAFDTLSPERRALICGIVQRSLEYASTRVEDWIVDGLSFAPDEEGKDRIIVTLEIQHSDIEDSMQALRYFYHTKVQQILEDMKEGGLDGG